MTPHWTHSFAMRARGGATADKWFSNGQSDVQNFFTAAGDELYLCGVPASGNITGSIASNVLTPATTPAYQQVLTGDPDDPLGVGFDYASHDSFDAANSGVHDWGALAWCFLTVINTTQFTGNTMFFGKYHDAEARGLMVRALTTNTTVQVLYRGNALQRTVTCGTSAPLGEEIYIFGWRNDSLDPAPTLGVYTSWATEVTTTGVMGDGSNSEIFSLGANSTRSSPAIVMGPAIIWSGAAAATVIADRATTLPAWWAS